MHNYILTIQSDIFNIKYNVSDIISYLYNIKSNISGINISGIKSYVKQRILNVKSNSSDTKILNVKSNSSDTKTVVVIKHTQPHLTTDVNAKGLVNLIFIYFMISWPFYLKSIK